MKKTEEADENYNFINNDKDKYHDDQCNHGGCDNDDHDVTIAPVGDTTVIVVSLAIGITLLAAIVVVVVVRVGRPLPPPRGPGDPDQYAQGEVMRVR